VWSPGAAVPVTIGAGLLEVAALTCYFRAMHAVGDAVMIESPGSLNVVVVPVVGVVLFGAVVPDLLAFGVRLSCLSASVFLCRHERGRAGERDARRAAAWALLSVVCTSSSIVLLERAHEGLVFLASLFHRCGGYVVGGAALLLLRPWRHDRRSLSRDRRTGGADLTRSGRCGMSAHGPVVSLDVEP